MSAYHINAFCIDRNEKFIFYGNKSGQVIAADISTFTTTDTVQAQFGSVHSMYSHHSLNIIAVLGQDNAVSVWIYNNQGLLKLICRIPTRDYTTDSIGSIVSESQAITLHDTKLRLATRSGNSHLLEFDFDLKGNFQLIKCLRPFKREAYQDHEGIVNLRYVQNSDQLLVGGVGGSIALVAKKKVVRRWNFGSEPIHWFEHFKGSVYYVATDSRFVVRLDIRNDNNTLTGDVILSDDIEHVTFNRHSNKLYISSFDKNVYEISEDCQILKSVYLAPFSIRWIKTLSKDPNTLIVQCRNGSLHQIDISTGQLQNYLRNMPNAIWSAVASQNVIYLAGESDNLIELNRQNISKFDRSISFNNKTSPIPYYENSYIKRMALNKSTNILALGYSNGKVIAGPKENLQEIGDMQSFIWDITFASKSPFLFVASASGVVKCFNLQTNETKIIFQQPEPIWSLALNETLGILALAQRNGSAFFLDIKSFNVVGECQSFRPKRMKWIDDNTLLITNSTSVDRMMKKGGYWEHQEHFIPLENTVEDFICIGNRYLVLMTYNRDLWLCDMQTGKKLYKMINSYDFTKGILALDKNLGLSDYPADFIAYGRDGVAFQYRVTNEQIVPIGPILKP